MKSQFWPRTLLLLSLAVSSSSAFKVYLYQGKHCNGADDGVVEVSLGHNGCHTNEAGIAESALIQAENSDGTNDSVVFYSTGDCNPNNAIAEGQSSCLTISSSFSNYKSFNVISGQSGGARKHSRDMAAELVSRTPADEIEYFGTNDPEWDLAEHDDSVVYHGKVEPYGEKTVKWHEESLGIYSGIPVEEWDDAVHVQNKTKVLWGLTYPIDFGIEDQLLRRDSDIEGRSLKGICDAFENCAEKVTTNVAGFTMNKVIPLAVSAYVALDNGNTAIWNYIHKHPKAVKFVARVRKNQIVNGVASAYVFTLLTGIGQHKEVAECSTVLKQRLL